MVRKATQWVAALVLGFTLVSGGILEKHPFGGSFPVYTMNPDPGGSGGGGGGG